MYLNVTGSSTAAGLSGVQVIRLPLVVTARGVMRGMGAVVIRRPHRRARGIGGLGALVDDQIASTLQSFMSSLQFQAEHGTAPTPADFQASLTYTLQNTCSDTTPTVDCPGGIGALSAAIATAVQTYTAAYNQALQAAAALQSTYTAAGLQQFNVPVTLPAAPTAAVASTSSPAAVSARRRGASPATMPPARALSPSATPQSSPPPRGAAIFSAPTPAPAAANGAAASSSTTSAAPPASSGFDLSALTGTAFTVGGVAIPVWGLLAVGGVALYAMTAGKKR